MAEEGTKSEVMSDAEKLCNTLDSISAKMDSIMDTQKRHDARMDAMESDREDSRKDEEGDKKEDASDRKDAKKDGEDSFKEWAKEEGDEPEHKDSKRKDGEEEGEEKGKPEDTAADRKRKDARRDARKDEGDEEEKKEEEKREDARRKDGDEEMDRKDAIADAVHSATAGLREQIATLTGRMPALLSDSERERFASIQERADSAFQAFGDRAPGPLDGETPTQYKRRLGGKLQSHSPKWKDARLSAIADDAVLDIMVGDIFADSITAATRGADLPAGQLMPVHTRSPAGHTYIDYRGDPRALSSHFRGRALRAGAATKH